jgi:selenocysteine-specific elongation factor
VLDPLAERHKRFDEQVIAALEARGGADLNTAIRESLMLGGRTEEELCDSLGVSAEELAEAIAGLIETGEVSRIGSHLMHRASLDKMEEKIGALLSEFHDSNPLRSGMAKEELRSRMGLKAGAFDEILSRMERLEVKRDRVSIAGFTPTLTARQETVALKIEDLYREGEFGPPSRSQVLASFADEKGLAEEILFFLLESGTLVRVSEDVIFHAEAMARIRAGIETKLAESGSITVSVVRDLFGTSRKYAVPVLEYMDKIGITRRIGDERVLAKRPKKNG